ncbi:sorbosone dehydrogenase family protein [Actinomadura miaoliensis]|uniref:Sorbosone dehydrogenase family protein n=1 Tax=Actinomadura miaoliensis TaxID=430685 RepID=A0ABP7VJF6_9ACTN
MSEESAIDQLSDTPAEPAPRPRQRRRLVKRVLVSVTGAVMALALLAVVGVYYLLNRGSEPQGPARLGPSPQLAPPNPEPIPKVNAPNVVGWPQGATPRAPEGFTVTAFATNLDHPRWLYSLPNGDVLAAEAATPPKDPDSLGTRLLYWLRRNDGAVKDSANRITLLRDTNGDGVADFRSAFLQNLNHPFGMAVVGDWFYVANTDAVWRYRYKSGDTRITAPGEKILDLPAGGYNNHWTRNIMPSADGRSLYVTVGSGSNAGENGLAAEKRRAVVLQVDLDGRRERVVASGIRNPNGLGVEPSTGTLWAVVNERDVLGDDVAPDYLTRVRPGDFYGWPWSYWGTHTDDRVKPPRPDLVAKAIRPDYSLGAHTAPLGLAFSTGTLFPEQYRGGAFIGEHGSWNRGNPVGYKVVYVPFEQGRPDGLPRDFLTGFRPDPKSDKTYGRPVGVIMDRAGGLLVADDAGNRVWRVAPESRS